MNRDLTFARIGAVCYFIWALLHFQAAWSVYQLGQGMAEGMARGRVLQDAWNLMWFSILTIVGVVGFNWRNDVRGWWINLAMVSVADIGFILFVLAPGLVPPMPGVLGPVFWILGLCFSSAANPWRRDALAAIGPNPTRPAIR